MTKRAAALLLPVLWLVAACTPVVIPGGPPQHAPLLQTEAVVAADGARLPLHAWLPEDDAPRAVILALHGFNDYGHFFDMPGRWLAQRGIASYAYDQRGFGQAPHRGIWPGTATLVRDVRNAAAALRRRHPGVPLYVLGESMGGAVALVAATSGPGLAADGLILSAPAVRGRDSLSFPARGALWLMAHTMPGMTVSGRGLGIQASDNVEMLRALGKDPLVIKETRVDTVRGLVDLMDAAQAAAPHLQMPALVLYGERDELIPEDAARRFFAGLPPQPEGRWRAAVYADGYHMLLRDLSADTVWRDIAAWIGDPAAPLPSGADVRAAAPPACRTWNICDRVFVPSQPSAARS